jgi:hypothetical protein
LKLASNQSPSRNRRPNTALNATSGAFLNFHWSVIQPTAPVEKSFKGISGLLTNILEEARSLQNEPN